MNGAAVVAIAAFATWLMLKAIRDVHGIRRDHRGGWLRAHQRHVRYDQTRREAEQSAPITWRR